MANIFNEPYCAIYNKVPHKEVKPGKKQVADFHYVKTIGEGSFAAVLKVSEKGSDREFAMKILEKVRFVIMYNLLLYTIPPTEILYSCSSSCNYQWYWPI